MRANLKRILFIFKSTVFVDQTKKKSKGTLRGYTERKILDGFDGMGAPDDSKVVGERRFQVVRSVPGRVLSQGIAASLDEYLSVSLQRRARIFLSASVSDEVEVLQARGLLVEALPDSGCFVDMLEVGSISASPRNVLSKLGFGNAGLKKSEPMKFACHCSPERKSVYFQPEQVYVGVLHFTDNLLT